MGEYRRFERHDWDAYAGAERFSGGAEPLIYEQDLSENGCVGVDVTVDKNGLEIHLFGDDGEDNIWNKDVQLTSLRAEGELRELIKVLKEYTYAPDLSYELDHPTHEATKGFTFC